MPLRKICIITVYTASRCSALWDDIEGAIRDNGGDNEEGLSLWEESVAFSVPRDLLKMLPY